ncbi:MAG: glycosyltransferase family 9 protein [Bacteroidota bacterium]
MRGNKFLKSVDYYVGSFLILLLAVFLRRNRIPPNRPLERILLIKLAALGDTVLVVPAMRAIRTAFPRAHVAMIVTSINADVVNLFPRYVDQSIDFQVGRVLRNPRYFFRLVNTIRNSHFDAVVDFEQWSSITPIITALSNAPVRVGFRTSRPVRHLLYTRSYPRHEDLHEAENFLGLLSTIGIHSHSPALELPVNAEKRKEVSAELVAGGWKKGRRLVVIHPGCGVHGYPREWPVERYRELCTRLLARNNVLFVFTAGKGEERLQDELVGYFPNDSFRWTAPGLDRLIALLSAADLLVSGNNGIMHLGAALGINQVALHGPTNAAKWGPLNRHATVVRSSCPDCPCLNLGFEYHRTDGYCMAQISVDEVYDAAQRLLKGKK